MFDEVSANSNATSSTTSTDSTPFNEIFDNGKCNTAELLKLLLNKIEAFEDHLTQINVRLNHLGRSMSNTQKAHKLGIVDLDQLKPFELPADSESGLENLDKKLKEDFEFKTKLVS